MSFPAIVLCIDSMSNISSVVLSSPDVHSTDEDD